MALELEVTGYEWDALVQGLTAIGLQLECADALLETLEKTEGAREALRRALSLTRSNLQAARESASGLRATPPTHSSRGDLSIREDPPDERPCG